MACLDHSEQIEPNPWFEDRLRAKINALGHESDPTRRHWGAALLRPALLGVILALNLGTMAKVVQVRFRQTASQDASLSDLATEYAYETSDSVYYFSGE